MGKVFVSYRRADGAGTVGRICDRLKTTFGTDRVFFDVDSIPLGVNFDSHIKEVLSSIDVMVVVVGPRWLGDENASRWFSFGRTATRRIDDPSDLVRLEVQTALEMGIPVIPAYIAGAPRLKSQSLPLGLRPLTDRNDIFIDDGQGFEGQISKLISSIEQHLGGGSVKGSGRARRATAREIRSSSKDYLDGALDNYVIDSGRGRMLLG